MAKTSTEDVSLMPCYTFLCDDCKTKFEIVCSYDQYKASQKCENCGSSNTVRSYGDDLTSVNMSIKLADSELKTIGDIAQRNSEKFSNDYKQKLYNEHNSYKNQTPMPLPNGMTRMR